MGNLDYLAVFDQHRKRAPRADIKEALPAAFEQDRVLRVLPTAEFRNVVAIKWDMTTDLLDVLTTAMERAQEVDGLLDSRTGEASSSAVGPVLADGLSTDRLITTVTSTDRRNTLPSRER